MKAKPEIYALPPLPKGFAESLAPLLKEELRDFLQSHEKPWQQGLRNNPKKVPEAGLDQWVEGLPEEVRGWAVVQLAGLPLS